MNPSFFLAAVLYLLFVVYGSLVPLEMNNVSFDEAVNQFKNIRYLNLGIGSRADWVANILLYIPLAFLGSAAFSGIRTPVARIILSLVVVVSCLLTAVIIEFIQLFFPPRTVSLNDLIAETLGTVAGVLGWQFFSVYLSNLYAPLLRGGLLSVRAAIIFYLLIYVTLSLFPFDFVTSFAELDAKLAAGNDAVFLSFDACSAEPLRCGFKLLVEMLALLPLGVLFCYLPYSRYGIAMSVLIGFFLGLSLEMVQIFLLSGRAQGISVLTRMVGMGAGAGVALWMKQRYFTDLARLLPRVVWIVIAPYLLLVLSINGWFADEWLTSGQALEKLTETHFLPLYYFYYTSEGVALVSLLSNLGLYFPVGLLCWAGFFSVSDERRHQAPHWFYVGLLAAGLALVVEAGKLFLVGKHADPSDIWLAFIAAAACYVFLNRVSQALHCNKPSTRPPPIAQPQPKPKPKPQIHHSENPAELMPVHEVDKNWRIVSFILWGIIAAALVNYPIAPLALAVFLIGYTALLMRFPYAWLIALPALLPTLDFAPWTGRFFFDEFDLLILTTIAFYYWQKPSCRMRSLLSMPTRLLLLVFVVLYCASMLKGLLPLLPINANAFTSYYSHYNSLRVGKGVLWALLLLPLLQQSVRSYRSAPLYLGYGMLAGLAGVIVASCWERFLFPGLFNFSSNYRIIALFSTMHTGGGHIDAYLALTLPFIALLFLRSSRLAWVIGVGLLVTGLYVLLVTFSRGPYLASALEFVVLAIALSWCFKGGGVYKPYLFLWLPLLAVIIVLVALPVFKGTFIQSRFNEVEQDMNIRMAHWRDAVAMMDDDVPTQLVGMGIGSYPRTYLWRNSENVTPAMYRLDSENSNTYLKLSAGDSLYMGQSVDIKPSTPYRLGVDLRSSKESVSLTMPLCEKSLLYSFRCSWSTVAEKVSAGQWRHIERLIDSKAVGEPLGLTVGSLSKRPVQLSLYNGAANTVVDVDNVSLTDATGRNLIANGSFTQGMDYWFFSTDNHLPWHIKNLMVHVLFDQGWLGVGAFFLLFANAVYNNYRKLRQHAVFPAILLSSFSGFVVVGLVDSPFDAPRLTLLFFLLLLFSLMRTPSVWAK